MNDQTLSADHDVSGERNRAKKNPNHAYDWRLIFDLERLMHYASTAKEVDVPIQICSDATAALQTAKTQMQNDGSLASATQMSLLKAIDDLSPKIYPVTTASLEIADALDVAKPDPSHQQLEIRRAPHMPHSSGSVTTLFVRSQRSSIRSSWGSSEHAPTS